MTVWLIEPRDPLIFRNGKPFGPTPGARAHSLAFPYPSTIAGGTRSQAALDNHGAFRIGNPRYYAGQEKEELKNQLQSLTTNLTIRGPLLVQIPQDGKDITPENWMVPVPRDVLIFSPEAKDLTAGQSPEYYGQLRQLVPLQPSSNSYHDLKQPDLLLIGMQQSEPDPRKPHNQTPRYWKWQTLQDWLLKPKTLQDSLQKLSDLGHNGPEYELRVHVSMDTDKHAGKPGALFDTSGLEFTHQEQHSSAYHLGTTQPLGLVVLAEDYKDFQVCSGPACLGSERRIVNWRRSACQEPTCPPELVKRIVKDQACRLILLTPAHFKDGYLPAWSKTTPDNWSLQPKIRAIAVDRPQIVSGWDIVNNRPKETRRLAPAGTVLFLSLKHITDEQTIRKWIRETWMHCVSDDKQDCADGFGLAVLGTWPEQDLL